MVDFNEIKELCEEHNKCLDKTKKIQEANRQRVWMKVVTGKRDEFYLGDDEMLALINCIESKGLKIEKRIQELFDYNNSECSEK